MDESSPDFNPEEALITGDTIPDPNNLSIPETPQEETITIFDRNQEVRVLEQPDPDDISPEDSVEGPEDASPDNYNQYMVSPQENSKSYIGGLDGQTEETTAGMKILNQKSISFIDSSDASIDQGKLPQTGEARVLDMDNQDLTSQIESPPK